MRSLPLIRFWVLNISHRQLISNEDTNPKRNALSLSAPNWALRLGDRWRFISCLKHLHCSITAFHLLITSVFTPVLCRPIGSWRYLRRYWRGFERGLDFELEPGFLGKISALNELAAPVLNDSFHLFFTSDYVPVHGPRSATRHASGGTGAALGVSQSGRTWLKASLRPELLS